MNIFLAALLSTALGASGAIAQEVLVAANQQPGASSSVLDEAQQLLAKSAQLANAGHRPEAVEAAQAAANELRGLQPPPDGQTAYLSLFTQALYTLTVRLIEAGRFDDAAPAAHEAVQVAGQAAAAPGADVNAIASLMLALSSQMATAGLRPGAVEAAQAAANELRGLQPPPDGQTAYLSLFTQALYTLTVRLIEAGRLDDAAPAAHEAVQVAGQAAAAPGADVNAIASLMLALSSQMANAGHRPEAVEAAQAAANELRGLQPPPDGQTAYLSLFTQALYTLTVRLIEAGRLDDAAPAAHEAVQVAGQAAAAPGADVNAIASLMLALSSQMATAGLRPGAVEAAQAAADILREEGARRKAWGVAMLRIPVPNKGCFNATYPKTELQEVPCVKAPDLPQNVGNGTDWSANVAAGNLISSATGSFDSVDGVQSETGSTFGPNCTNQVTRIPNIFSLQLNTQQNFTTKPAGIAACQTAAGCQGWQQFMYSSTFNVVYIQYWLLGFGPTCPAGWKPSKNSCFQNSPATTTVPAQTIANLRDMTLMASADTAFDTVKILIAGDVPSLNVSNQDSALALATNWQTAEFNVFGDFCSSQTVFNNGSTIVVRTQVNAGARIAPTCTPQGFTGETNNLNLVGTPANVQTSAEPAIVFTESNAPGGTPSTCTVSGGGLICFGVASSGSTNCTDAGGVASTCATAACPAGLTLMGGGGACAAGGTRIKSLFPRQSDGSFNITCEKQGVDPQAQAICCRL